MTPRLGRQGWPGPEYHVQASSRAPLRFVFSWCTDFGPGDAKLEGEEYRRKVLARDGSHVVFEDLDESPEGWEWARYDVTLRPPDAWYMENRGNHVQVVADYQLTALSADRTRLDLRWRRRPGLLEFTPRSKAEGERSGTIAWKRFAQALERDYRTTKSRPQSRRRAA
jgi:hypothetical protein